MEIQISGQHFNVGESFTNEIKEKLNKVISKYFDHATNCHVFFRRETFQIECEIVLNLGIGRHKVIKTNAKNDEAHYTFDVTVAKLEKLLRKYKEKINDKSGRVKTSEAIDAIQGRKYVISSNTQEENEELDFDNPVIIAEREMVIESLSIGDAVTRMEIENLPALLFKNTNNNRLNLVYLRKDGNISWVDPQN